jgi:hypothetical protein
MDFGRYLYLTRALTFGEYHDVLSEQANRCLSQAPAERDAQGNARGLCARHLSEFVDVEPVREPAFGDVLQTMPGIWPNVRTRTGEDLSQLVDDWRRWHRDTLEPIPTYSMSSKFGA